MSFNVKCFYKACSTKHVKFSSLVQNLFECMVCVNETVLCVFMLALLKKCKLDKEYRMEELGIIKS